MPNWLLCDRSFAFPLRELDGTQPAPPVRDQTAQCSFDLGRTDTEETHSSGNVLVHAGDARFQQGPPVAWSNRPDSGVDALFRAFR